SILRRAERYGRQYLGATGPFLNHLVPRVAIVMGDAFPELGRDLKRVIATVREEEESFYRTLDRGIRLFQEAAERAQHTGNREISGADAFQLHDTYGVYIDITEQMAHEVGLGVDRTGFYKAMEEARKRSRAGTKQVGSMAVYGDLPGTDDSAKYKELQ